MKPEELDELFRRGLADQQAPPRPAAWAAIQQRLSAAAPAEADEELPAFLLRTPAPAAPLMTASRGGAARTAATPGAWYQGPALRAAAAVVLLVGGGALALRSGLADADVADAASAREEAVEALAAHPDAPVVTPQALVAVEPAPEPEASAVTAAFAMAPPEAAAEPAPMVAVAAAPRSMAAGRRQTARAAHGSHERRRAETPAAAPVLVASTRTHRPAADSQAFSTRTALAATTRPTAPSSLTVGEVADATLAAATTAPAAHGFVNVRSADLPNATALDEDETIEVDGGTVGRLVARAMGRPARITSPNALLRRGAGHVRDMLDRADNAADGQLTIETRVVGRPVRKTISL